jgi:hypothetical protein
MRAPAGDQFHPAGRVVGDDLGPHSGVQRGLENPRRAAERSRRAGLAVPAGLFGESGERGGQLGSGQICDADLADRGIRKSWTFWV